MVPSPLHEKCWLLVQKLVDRYLAAVVGSGNTAAARFAKEIESNGSALIAAEKRIDPDYEQEENMLSFEESSYGTTESSVAGQDTRRSLRAFEAPVQPSSSPVPSESSTAPVGISPDFSWHYLGDTGSSVTVEIANSESLDHLRRKAERAIVELGVNIVIGLVLYHPGGSKIEKGATVLIVWARSTASGSSTGRAVEVRLEKVRYNTFSICVKFKTNYGDQTTATSQCRRYTQHVVFHRRDLQP